MLDIKDKLKELLNVIDFELCELNNNSVTIKDKLNEDGLNEIINLPIDYESTDRLRIFRSSQIKENYFFKVLNTKYPKKPFTKNSVGFEISMSKEIDSNEDEQKFVLELYHNKISYKIFIGKNRDEEYFHCIIKDKEYIGLSYTVKSDFKKVISVSSDCLSQSRKELTVIKSEKDNSIIIKDLKEIKQSVTPNDINNYFNATLYRLKGVIEKVLEVITLTNENFLEIIYNDYPFIKDFINLTGSEIEEELINTFFDNYLNIDIMNNSKDKKQMILTRNK